MAFPLIGVGMVVSHHPSRHAVYVMLRSGQMPSQPVQVGFDGPADAVRLSQEELPTKGTWGVICFPQGDSRNGIWLRSYYAQNQDAIPSDTDPFLHYKAEWSGYWEHRDKSGNESRVFPDGTAITYSATGALPTVYRHVVDGAQVRQQVPFTQTERVPNPPAPFIYTMAHASGTQVQVDSAGNTTVTGASSATLTLNFGGTTLVIDANGDLTVTAGSTTVTVDKNGQIALDSGANPVAITASTVALMIQTLLSVSAGGGATSEAPALAAALVSWLTSHTHTGNGAGASTSTPDQALTTADVASTTIKMSG